MKNEMKHALYGVKIIKCKKSVQRMVTHAMSKYMLNNCVAAYQSVIK